MRLILLLVLALCTTSSSLAQNSNRKIRPTPSAVAARAGSAVDWHDDLEGAMRFIDATQLPYQAPSLGGVESLIELPITMSYWDVDPEERLAMGITDSLVRLACGVEDGDDLIEDLSQALDEI